MIEIQCSVVGQPGREKFPKGRRPATRFALTKFLLALLVVLGSGGVARADVDRHGQWQLEHRH